jgi:hypothetical protein
MNIIHRSFVHLVLIGLAILLLNAVPTLAGGEPSELADMQEIVRRIRDRARERVRRMDEKRLQEIRDFLGIKSDQQWTALSPRIKRVMQLRRLRDQLRTGGSPALDMPVPPSMQGMDQLSAHLALWSPDLEGQWVEELASARAGLARGFHDPHADEQDLGKALSAWSEARQGLCKKLESATQDLRKTASPRQRMGLTLQGILPY